MSDLSTSNSIPSTKKEEEGWTFIPLETRLVGGFQRYFEGLKDNIPYYSSYVDWYTDILELMQSNVPYLYEDVFFVKVVTNKRLCDFGVRFVSKNNRYDKNNKSEFCTSNNSFSMPIVQRGWTHDTTKYILILHPKHLQNPLEMVKSCTDDHHWYTNNVSNYNVTRETSGDQRYFNLNKKIEIIVCGKRKEKKN